jgi:hypothetical protein
VCPARRQVTTGRPFTLKVRSAVPFSYVTGAEGCPSAGEATIVYAIRLPFQS